jgi:subtilisin family serine protease
MPPSRRAEPAREPRLPHPDRLATVQARVLDPARSPVADGSAGRPTAYVADRVMIVKDRRTDPEDKKFKAKLDLLRQVASDHGWYVEQDEPTAKERDLPLGVFTVRVTANSSRRQPDAWHLLQFVRQAYGRDALRGVDLDHIVSTAPFSPAHWEIPHPNHWEIPHPDSASAVSAGLASYGQPGFGGRQPIAYAGPPPPRDKPARGGRRPVVALLDTGCYPHQWFDGGVVRTDVELHGQPIGYTGKASDPEVHGNLVGPLDGSVDRIAGHGTFIAGLVHQVCPDATILAWRGIETTKALVESEWLTTLAQITELVRLDREGKAGGHPIDVLSLSLGYYHENDSDDLLDPILWTILAELGRLGVVVVCSAGNDATERPCYPAAFAPWSNKKGPYPIRRNRVPVVSAGALNPNATDALFSNTGPWVRAYAPGAAVMSTMPPFNGGLQAVDKLTVLGRVRESVDPDDFHSGEGSDGRRLGGFGLWSGTSFSAPVIAGRIASSMSRDLMKGASARDTAAAVRRGWKAVEAETEIRRTE